MLIRATVQLVLIATCSLAFADNEGKPMTLRTCADDTTVYDLRSKSARIVSVDQSPLTFAVGDGKGSDRLTITAATAVETPRKTQIVVDAEAVLNAVKAKISPPGGAPAGPDCAEYTPKNLRSTLQVSVKAGDQEVNKTYTVGPPEHLFLSADAVVSDVKQLKLDSSTNKVVESKTPASIYLGVSYKIGDIYTNYAWNDVPNNLVVKLIARASSKPASSYGLGLGYSTRFCDLFVGRVTSAADSSVPAGQSGRTQSTIVGLSFNVAQGIAWLAGKE